MGSNANAYRAADPVPAPPVLVRRYLDERGHTDSILAGVVATLLGGVVFDIAYILAGPGGWTVRYVQVLGLVALFSLRAFRFRVEERPAVPGDSGGLFLDPPKTWADAWTILNKDNRPEPRTPSIEIVLRGMLPNLGVAAVAYIAGEFGVALRSVSCGAAVGLLIFVFSIELHYVRRAE